MNVITLDLGLALNLMTRILIRRKEDRHTQGRRPCEERADIGIMSYNASYVIDCQQLSEAMRIV